MSPTIDWPTTTFNGLNVKCLWSCLILLYWSTNQFSVPKKTAFSLYWPMWFSCVLWCVSGPVERVYLSAPIVAIRKKEANLTAVVWPVHHRTLTFFWWFENSSEVRFLHPITLTLSLFAESYFGPLCFPCALEKARLCGFLCHSLYLAKPSP